MARPTQQSLHDGALDDGALETARRADSRDVPRIDVHLVENREMAPASGGETPIIAAAPAIANAVFAASGVRLRSLPLSGQALRSG